MNSNSEILFASLENRDYKRGYEDCKKEYESRTCKNCKHLSDGRCTLIGDWDCYNDDFIDWCPPSDDFGCNSFERK